MRITWYGHAAFLVETHGLRIILDPFRPADIVAVSHENDVYHSHLGQIVPPFEVVRGLELPPGGIEVRGVRFEASPCFETPEKKPGDEVTILHFRSEGLHLVHVGDLGHALSDTEVAPLVGADILLVAAGGPPTLDVPEVPRLLESIGPRIVVPMHYKTPRININIQPVERFLEVLPDWPVERPGSCSF